LNNTQDRGEQKQQMSSQMSSNSRHIPSSCRDILEFRVSSKFEDFFLSLQKWAEIDQQSLAFYIETLKVMTTDYDFARQFGEFGGHMILKQLIKNATDDISQRSLEAVSSILATNCSFPMTKSVSCRDDILRPLSYKFFCINSALEGEREELSILLRQIPNTMHGEGQVAVGYIIWSAAIILSRLFIL
jgi:hypothetical protein